ncbi:hypothetical protein [Actinomadura decatromicini]|uniref:Uncharacterized protein n=1 Tax=Actinomadura decatromicini TaxID=2604572 RepID=A0A5D3FBM0_9ACTN|nr:hypothetical protein [Actinomadura decatromicini]TYK45226.1 hypothetical protein FXF68_31610 [Actinomadura decatromicini]
MTAPRESRPWWTPGMPAGEVAIWEAAERAAESAPTLGPGDDVYQQIRQSMGGCLAPSARREERGAA